MSQDYALSAPSGKGKAETSGHPLSNQTQHAKCLFPQLKLHLPDTHLLGKKIFSADSL